MIELIRANQEKVTAVCRRFGVERLEVFGSAARGDFRPGESDIDFIVEFEPSARRTGILDRYLAVAEELERILNTGVELITPGSLHNPHFCRAVEKCKEQVYAA
jgi:hypothetical protein